MLNLPLGPRRDLVVSGNMKVQCKVCLVEWPICADRGASTFYLCADSISHSHTLSHLQTATKIVRLTTNVVDDKLVEVAVRCLLSNACFSPFSTTRAQILSNFHAYIWTLHIHRYRCANALIRLHIYIHTRGVRVYTICFSLPRCMDSFWRKNLI